MTTKDKWHWIAERGRSTFQIITLKADEPGVVDEIIANGLTLRYAQKIVDDHNEAMATSEAKETQA